MRMLDNVNAVRKLSFYGDPIDSMVGNRGRGYHLIRLQQRLT